MIQMQTVLNVADKHRRAFCDVHQGAHGGSKRRYAGIGDTQGVDQGCRACGRVKRATFPTPWWFVPPRVFAVPTDLAHQVDGNAAVLLNTKLEPIGTRIFGR